MALNLGGVYLCHYCSKKYGDEKMRVKHEYEAHERWMK